MSIAAKNEETRQRLIAAAGQVFADVGYEAATVRQITERAGANVAAINYYFRDKIQLYREVLKTITRGLVQVLSENCVGETGEEQLYRFVRAIMSVKLQEEYPWASLLMAREITELHEGLADFIVEAVRPLHAITEQIVARVSPEATPEQIKVGASCVITLCVHRVHQQRLDQRMFPGMFESDGDVEAAIEPIYRFALAGIRGLCSAAP